MGRVFNRRIRTTVLEEVEVEIPFPNCSVNFGGDQSFRHVRTGLKEGCLKLLEKRLKLMNTLRASLDHP